MKSLVPCLLLACLLLVGCGSFMEKVVPSGNPTWQGVANAGNSIRRGTPKWVVKMKLGTPAASSPSMWQYVYYGNNIAKATIYFDEKGRVTDVQASSDKAFDGIRVRRK